MPDILTPFFSEHLLSAIIFGTFGWGLLFGFLIARGLQRHMQAAQRRRALRSRLVGGR